MKRQSIAFRTLTRTNPALDTIVIINHFNVRNVDVHRTVIVADTAVNTTFHTSVNFGSWNMKQSTYALEYIQQCCVGT